MKIYSRNYVSGFSSESINICDPCVLVDTDLGLLIISTPGHKVYIQFKDSEELYDMLQIEEYGERIVIIQGRKYKIRDIINKDVDLNTMKMPIVDWI